MALLGNNISALTNLVRVSAGYGFDIRGDRKLYEIANIILENANKPQNVSGKSKVYSDFKKNYQQMIIPLMNVFLEQLQHIQYPMRFGIN